MLAFKTLFHVFAVTYRLIVTSWNACFVLHQMVRSVMQEAKREAAELMAFLDDGGPALAPLLHDANAPANGLQMLIIAKASSFVLLIQLSKLRVLHLEVDEKFIVAKLEVIRTEFVSHVQHVPSLLQLPIGTHDTRLVRYTPIKLPYLWKETEVEARCEATASTEVAFADPTAAVSARTADTEERAHRKKYVQLLAESAVRRRLHMDQLPAASELTPKGGLGVAKGHGESVVKRKVLANATNVTVTHPEGSAGEDRTPDEPKTTVTDTSKHARVRAALSENSNVAPAATVRKVGENLSAQQPARRMQSLRRKRGQFDLYAKGVASEFSLVSKTGQGSN